MSGRNGVAQFHECAVRQQDFEINEGLFFDDGNVIIRTNDDRVLAYWSHVTTLRRARLAHNLNKLFRPLGNQRTLPFADRLDIDEVGANAERRGASTNKVGGSLERDAASRHELDLRQRRL